MMMKGVMAEKGEKGESVVSVVVEAAGERGGGS